MTSSLPDNMDVREDRQRGRWLGWLKLLFRVLVLALVTWGIWKTVLQSRLEFATHQFSLQQVDSRWLLAAGLLYLAGLAPCGVFWHRTLWAMGQRPTWRESMRAFWIGHLGKYVPGKAMVVILRTGLIYSERVNRTVAATSVFIETLTMMAVGAFVSAVILLLVSDHVVLTWLAVGLMLLSGVPTYPPLFRRIVRWLQIHRANPQIDQALAGVGGRLMGFGWLIISLGWLALGLSLWATLRSIPNPGWPNPDWVESLRDLPLLSATVGLAMVAGFLSLIPGGLGVRDWILMTLLAPTYGARTAIVSAVLLRFVWLLSELVVSAILYVDVLRVRRRIT
ncbi:MAG: lysylphosphatidylglycerol synthase transmembrane domain-containing protein [Pirellulaceae bacterium]